MNLVSDLDLPTFDYTAPDFSADRYHAQLAETRQLGWLAKSPLACIVLDHDSGEFFLRSRATAFPGRQIAEFFGVTGGPNSRRRWRSSRRAATTSPWTGRRNWAASRKSTGSTSSRSSGRVHRR
jgi:hypothetical protein